MKKTINQPYKNWMEELSEVISDGGDEDDLRRATENWDSLHENQKELFIQYEYENSNYEWTETGSPTRQQVKANILHILGTN